MRVKLVFFKVMFESPFRAILRVNLNRKSGNSGVLSPVVCQSAASARPGMWRGQPQPGFCCLSISGHRSQN